MDFSLHISQLNQYRASTISDALANGHAQFILDKSSEPKLEWLKPMQRRRLSTFAKLGLFCAQSTMGESNSKVDTVFSSRHGDLHKTSELLADLASDESLSPTTFSLSVHNAVAGLHSIFTSNTAPNTAISAGKETFLMAMLDAYCKLKSGMSEQILLVHIDRVLPTPYEVYADETQIDHAVSCLLTLPSDQQPAVNFSSCPIVANTQGEDSLPLSLAFADWFQSESGNKQLALNGAQCSWQVERSHV
ncbi:beta-ketoacyl synthase chain length factor [Thalassotalea fusca]